MKLNFEDTHIAFTGRSDKEILHARRLFGMMSFPWLVNLGNFFIPLFIKMRLPIKWLLKPTVFKHFCGGEDIIEALSIVKRLHKANVGTVLDYAAEGINSEEAFENTKKEIINVITTATEVAGIPFAVFKMTGLASADLLEKVQSQKTLNPQEQTDYENILLRVDAICLKAFEEQIPIFIDAEESWIQDAIDNIVLRMMEKYNNTQCIVYNTLQMYRHDRYAYLVKLTEAAPEKAYKIGIKFVRGAYMEKERKRAAQRAYPSPIHIDKPATDKAFNEAVSFAAEHLGAISFCVATHNEESIMLLTEIMTQNGLKADCAQISSAQLYGMSDNITFNLAHTGFRVAKYVPYGPVNTVVPYLMRRAMENTSVAGQTSRELKLIKKEIRRRKL